MNFYRTERGGAFAPKCPILDPTLQSLKALISIKAQKLLNESATETSDISQQVKANGVISL